MSTSYELAFNKTNVNFLFKYFIEKLLFTKTRQIFFWKKQSGFLDELSCTKQTITRIAMPTTFEDAHIAISKTTQESLEKCVAFLHSIGIVTQKGTEVPGSFLPGLTIQNGIIYINENTLENPGDILHEAGHIAVVPAAERQSLNAESIQHRKDREAEEMMAIAWSYAACVHLELDARFVFHDNGYKGGGSHLAENFTNKRYIGLPMLQWIGLALDEKNAASQNEEPYPHMQKWLRD